MSTIITAAHMWAHLSQNASEMGGLDDWMDGLVDGAIARFERKTGQPLFKKAIQIEFDGRDSERMTLGYRPMSALTKLESINAAGEWEEIAVSAYRLEGNTIRSLGGTFSSSARYRASVSVGHDPADPATADLIELIKVAVEMEYMDSPNGKGRRTITSESGPDQPSKSYSRQEFRTMWDQAVELNGRV